MNVRSTVAPLDAAAAPCYNGTMATTRTTSFRLSPATHAALARLRDRLRLASQAAVVSAAVATLERVLDAGEAAAAKSNADDAHVRADMAMLAAALRIEGDTSDA